jgi:hypothetical protein
MLSRMYSCRSSSAASKLPYCTCAKCCATVTFVCIRQPSRWLQDSSSYTGNCRRSTFKRTEFARWQDKTMGDVRPRTILIIKVCPAHVCADSWGMALDHSIGLIGIAVHVACLNTRCRHRFTH